MSKSERALFDQYLLELLADADRRNADLESQVRGLRAFAERADIRLLEIEEEVGRLREALRAAGSNKA
jgi:hypothetical protein